MQEGGGGILMPSAFIYTAANELFSTMRVMSTVVLC